VQHSSDEELRWWWSRSSSRSSISCPWNCFDLDSDSGSKVRSTNVSARSTVLRVNLSCNVWNEI
jgi:hypothetical protein